MSLRDIDFGDFSYTIPTAITWTYAEMGVIILVACSPMLRPLFDQLFKRFLSNIGRSGGSGPYALSQNTNNTNNNNNNPNDFDGRPVRRRAAHDGSEDSLGLYATSTSDVHGEARATGGKDAGSDSKSDKDGGTAVTTVPMV